MVNELQFVEEICAATGISAELVKDLIKKRAVLFSMDQRVKEIDATVQKITKEIESSHVEMIEKFKQDITQRMNAEVRIFVERHQQEGMEELVKRTSELKQEKQYLELKQDMLSTINLCTILRQAGVADQDKTKCCDL
jgi:CRISPR/Cas system-associated endonuclease Cas3-HD